MEKYSAGCCISLSGRMKMSGRHTVPTLVALIASRILHAIDPSPIFHISDPQIPERNSAFYAYSKKTKTPKEKKTSKKKKKATSKYFL